MSVKRGLEFQVGGVSKVMQGKGRVQGQGKASGGFARQGKAMRVLEGKGKVRLDVDECERKSGGGWVSKSMQGNGEKAG